MIPVIKKFIEKLYLGLPDNLVMYDQLTGAKTRYYYDTVLKPKYENEEVFVAFIDVDNLKVINDEKGHQAGSDILKEVVNQLKDLEVTEICRIGGDEFIVIADKSFIPQNLNNVSNVSYGYVIKKVNESLSSSVHVADGFMYKRKNKIHKRKNRKS